MVVIKFSWRGIAFVFKCVNTNKVPPFILQANTSKKVGIGCLIQPPLYCLYLNSHPHLSCCPLQTIISRLLGSNFFFMVRRILRCWSFRSQDGLKIFMLEALWDLTSIITVSDNPVCSEIWSVLFGSSRYVELLLQSQNKFPLQVYKDIFHWNICETFKCLQPWSIFPCKLYQKLLRFKDWVFSSISWLHIFFQVIARLEVNQAVLEVLYRRCLILFRISATRPRFVSFFLSLVTQREVCFPC